MRESAAVGTKLARGALLAVFGWLATAGAGAAEVPREPTEVWSYLAGLPAEERLQVLEREAKSEEPLLLYGATGLDRANFWIGEFNKRYPDIKVEFIRLTATDLVSKLTLERETGNDQADLVITTITYLDLLSGAQVLAPYVPTTWEKFDERFRFGDGDSWTAVVYEIFPHAIAWRSDRVAADQAPKSLVALTDASWQGRIGTTTHLEDTINGLQSTLGEAAAEDLLQRLAGQNNRLYKSHAALADGIAAGEVDVAWGIVAARPVDLQAKGAPVDWVLTDPPMAEGNTLSVASHTGSPYSAALFMEVMLDAPTLEASDQWQGGRIFGNGDGSYAISLADYPHLFIFPPLTSERFSALNDEAQRRFVRRQQ